jgi:hypothetical protein
VNRCIKQNDWKKDHQFRFVLEQNHKCSWELFGKVWESKSMVKEGMQLCRMSAQDQVFAKGDLVFLFKDCFTVHNFACSKKFRRYAQKGELDIKPVAVRADMNMREYEAYDASRRKVKLKISDIEWPLRLDPTAPFDLIRIILEPERLFENAVMHVVDLRLMAKMLETHAAHLKRLKIRMALAVQLSDNVHEEPQYHHIQMFLTALAKCTAMETLIIEQSDHVAKDVKLHAVQFRMFGILQNMNALKVLDYNGNMTVDAFAVDPEDDVRHNLTVIDFLPRSLCELVVRDGVTPRLSKWSDPLGFSLGLKRVMSNHKDWFPLLKKIALPNSFWSLRPHGLNLFIGAVNVVNAVNANHITHIGFSDAFELKEGESANLGGVIVTLPAAFLALDLLILGLERDVVIDMRGAGDAEREERIEWAMDSPEASFLEMPNERSDGEGCTTVTMRKKNSCMVQVLI